MAYNNRLTGYQGNSKTVFCSVYDSSNNIMDLTGYSGTFYLQPINKTELVLTKIGTLDPSALAFIFELSTTDTSLAAADYNYQVDVSSATKKITVVSDKFRLLDAIQI